MGKWIAAGRLGFHVGSAPFSPIGGLLGRLGWGGAQAGMGIGAYGDMKKGEADRQLWEALRRGYLNRLPQLDTETVE